jgi:hypothetical protein
VNPPDRIKKHSKRNTTLKVKTSNYYWAQQSEDVSHITSTCQAEEIFGLELLDGACYFRGPPLTTGWWDPAVCHEPCVKIQQSGM